MDFTISHAYVHGILYVRRDRPALTRTAELRGRTLATISGTLAHSNATAHGGWGATIRDFQDPRAAVDAVRRGEADGLLLTYAMDRKYVKPEDGLKREFVDDIVHHFRIAVRKGDVRTLERLNDALATLRYNGTFDRLYDRWLGPIEPHPIRLADLKPHLPKIIAGAAAIAAIIWWQRRMLARLSAQAEALRDSEERYRGLIDSAFEGWMMHQREKIVSANASFASMFGYTVPELIGLPVGALVAPEHRDDLFVAASAARDVQRELVGLRKDGTRVPFEISGKSCKLNGEPARLVAVRDLTARRQVENDRLVLSKLESTGLLAGGIAHDFNNLIAGVVLNLDMARMSLPADSESLGHLQTAKQAALAASQLTHQLIAFARGGTSVRRLVRVEELVQPAVPLALSGSNVRGEIDLAADLPPVRVDPDQIARALGNLVLNSREAMPGGGVVRIEARQVSLPQPDGPALPPGDYVCITVRDRGQGIEPQVLPKIFDPYFSTKERGAQKGMGLGLTISHTIFGRHGGAVTVHSAVGEGSAFLVYLPVAAAESRGAPPPPAAKVPILVMDDEAAMRESVRRALLKMGFEVEAVEEGGAAVARFAAAREQGRPFGLVILDLTVRGGPGGKETLANLRRIEPKVKAIAMSGYSDSEVMQDFAAHGFRAALAKPFEFEELGRVASRVIAEA
jgi:PAS domain S-box-containing protein